MIHLKECPKCNDVLIPGPKRRYETLVEHVSDPNKYYEKQAPLRETLICPNNCYGHLQYWDYFYGDSYTHIPAWYRVVWKITDFKWPKYPTSAPDLETPHE